MKSLLSLFCLIIVLALLAGLQEPLRAETICEIQDWDPATGFSPYVGRTVEITGYVTVGIGIFQEGNMSIYLVGVGSDDCGINVFCYEPAVGLELGDKVRATGLVEDYVYPSGYGAVTELTFTDPSSLVIIEKGDGTSPPPVPMSTGSVSHESNEGKLVTVSAIVVSSIVGRDFMIDDGTGAIEVYDRGENFYMSDSVWINLSYGDEVVITGIVSQSDPDMPYLSGYNIMPRSPEPPYEDVKKKECIPGGSSRAVLRVNSGIFAPSIGETVTIEFNSPHGGRMQLRVFDGSGRLSATLFDGLSVCGERTLVWDGRNEVWEALPVGLYLITLTCEDPETGSESMETVPVVIGRELR